GEYAAQKREEARQSAAIYGAECFVFDYRDGELPVGDEVKFRICDAIRECRPRAVIGHWQGSMHKDHTNAALNLPDAIFYAAIKGFERALPPHGVGPAYYAENWEDREGFVPEVYLSVTADDMALWERAARAHALFRGGVSRFPYIEYYKSLARVRGCEVGLDLAVAFGVPPSAHRRKVTAL
ncbi:MAG: PIG-L family deacetylase, partial [Armatimonadetes bacterium]|nr:PIG-L family deacetylase [Armatimonadota bacterium]